MSHALLSHATTIGTTTAALCVVLAAALVALPAWAARRRPLTVRARHAR